MDASRLINKRLAWTASGIRNTGLMKARTFNKYTTGDMGFLSFGVRLLRDATPGPMPPRIRGVLASGGLHNIQAVCNNSRHPRAHAPRPRTRETERSEDDSEESR